MKTTKMARTVAHENRRIFEDLPDLGHKSFKILKIKAREYGLKRGRRIEFKVDFRMPAEDLYWFGQMLPTFRAAVLVDKEAVMKYWENPPPMKFKKLENGFSQLLGDPKSPWKTGAMKAMDCDGSDCIHVKKNSYSYREWVVASPATKAIIKQIKKMKEENDRGICRFGDYPDQAGCWRSGSVSADFACLCNALHLMWD